MRYRHEKLSGNSLKICFIIILVVSIVFLSIRAVEKALGPSVDSLCRYYCDQSAVYTANKCVGEVLKRDNITYSDLSEIKYDDSGNISSIDINTIKVNQLQAEIVQSIMDDISESSDDYIEVPIGSISGYYIFNGHGPKVRIRITSRGNIKTELRSKFEEAGINQSCHRLYLDIYIDMAAIFSGGEKKTTIKSSCMLAETIIVGDVPQGILNT